MISMKKMMITALFMPMVAFGAAHSNAAHGSAAHGNNDQMKKSLEGLVQEYTDMLGKCSTAFAWDKRGALFDEIHGRVFGRNVRLNEFTAAVLRKGSTDEVLKILDHLAPHEPIVLRHQDVVYRGGPLHYLAQRAVAVKDYKTGQLLNGISNWLSNPNRRCALTMSDSCNEIPFDSARNEIGGLGDSTCTQELAYWQDLLRLLAPDVEGPELDARNLARDLASDSKEVFERAKKDFESASADFAAMVRSQFEYVKPGVRFDPYLMRDRSVVEILIKFVLKNETDEQAMLWARFLLSPNYERSDEITQEVRDALLFSVIKMRQGSDAVVDELLSLGADPCAQIKAKDGFVVPIIQAVLNLRRPNDDLGAASEQVYQMLFAAREKFGVGSQPNESISAVTARCMREQERLALIKKLRELLGEFGEKQSAEAYEEYWDVWESICEELGADVPGLRKMVFPLLKKKPDANDYRLLKVFQKDYDSFHRFAMACVMKSFVYYMARSFLSHEVYDLRQFCNNGIVVESAPEYKEEDSVWAERYKAHLKPDVQSQIATLICKLIAPPKGQSSAASSSSAS